MSFNQANEKKVYNSVAYNDFYNNMGNGMPPAMASYNPKNKATPPNSAPIPVAAPLKGSRKRWSRASKLGLVFIVVVVVVVVIAALGLVGGSSGSSKESDDATAGGGSSGEAGTTPTPSPTAFPTTFPTAFPTTPAPTTGSAAPQDDEIENADIVRSSDQLVGLAFFTEMGAEETAAFTNAQARWSRIVGGTLASWPTFTFNAGTDVCGSGETTIEKISFNFLLILAGITPIDGAFGILGQAGPCRIATFNGNVMPVAGRMEFDSADIELMKSDGTLVSVILHEMGHVLGIGTLWGSNNLIINEVASANANVQPAFLGTEGIRRFDLANDGKVDDGFTFVPVENGFTNGKNNGAGSGSLNGHWDEDGTPGELMVFEIAGGATPPLSAITIGALQDAGYVVDFSEADAFTTPAARAEQARLRGSGARVYQLANDIHPYEIKMWDE